MSVQALGWVLDHSPTHGSDRLVLIALANHAGRAPAGDAWESWPGIDTIAREAGLGRTRTVNDALTRLIDAGAVERIVNGAPDERIRRDRRPNLYRVVIAHGLPCGVGSCGWCGVTRDAPRGDDSRPDGVTGDDATGCREASAEPAVNPQDEPSEEPEDPFDAFWAVYPRRDDKGAARRAFTRAIAKAGSIAVIVGAKRYRDDPGRDPRYTKLPATWLNAEAWANGPLPPRPPRPRGATPQPLDDDRLAPAGPLEL